MDRTIAERTLPLEPKESTLPDVEAIVTDCISEDADAFTIQQKLTSAIAQATVKINAPGEAQAYQYLKYLAKIAKGLRKSVEAHHAFRFFYFGQFQAQVDLLEQKMEDIHSESQVLSVAGRKHFASIMRLLYTEKVCQQQYISNKLKINRSNLSRELQRLERSRLVESTSAGRFRYHQLTPQGRRYYNTYLLMKDQLEEQIYSPSGQDSAIKGHSYSTVLFLTTDRQGRFLPEGHRVDPLFMDEDTKTRPNMIYNFEGGTLRCQQPENGKRKLQMRD